MDKLFVGTFGEKELDSRIDKLKNYISDRPNDINEIDMMNIAKQLSNKMAINNKLFVQSYKYASKDRTLNYKLKLQQKMLKKYD